MYSNKMSANNLSQLENTITVTPIKMEIGVTPLSATQDITLSPLTTALTTTNSIRHINDMDSGISCKIEDEFSGSTATIINSGTSVTKEKLLMKSSKITVPRKPPPTVDNFWPNILQEIKSTQMVDAKHQALPLARIKKIMKLDENSKMIAAEAPLLFAKACEFFIQELTMRAWIHTEESKRRTLQRSDIAQAIANYDQFDFLIDIVPREDIKPSGHHRKHDGNAQNSANPATGSTSMGAATVLQNTTAIPTGGSIMTNSKQIPATGAFASSSSSTSSSSGSELNSKLAISNLPMTATPSNAMNIGTGIGAPSAVEAYTLSTMPAETLTALSHSGQHHQHHQIPTVSSMTASALQPHQVLSTGQCPAGGQQVQIIQQTSNVANSGHHNQQHGSQQQMQYFITLPGQQATAQHHLQLHQLQFQPQQLPTGLAATPLAGVNLVSQQPQQLILTKMPNVGGTATANLVHQQQQQQQQATILQNFAAQQQQQQQQQQIQQPIQLLQQVVLTPSGEVANVPLAINTNQLNLLRLQMSQQHTTPVQQAIQHQQQQQQQPQPQQHAVAGAQQIIIPSQLLTAQQLLQFQATTQQQQQQQQQPQQTGGTAISQSSIFGNINQVTTQMISNVIGASVERGGGGGSSSGGGGGAQQNNASSTTNVGSYRTNC